MLSCLLSACALVGGAPCADGLTCSLNYYSYTGQCFPPDRVNFVVAQVWTTQVFAIESMSTSTHCCCDSHATNCSSCARAGYACYEGLTCTEYYVSPAAAYSTNYTACSETSQVCECSAGPIPVNGYCFIYGESLHLLH